MFMDERIFTIEQYFNKPNDHIYAESSKEAFQLINRKQHGFYSTSVMVWWGVSHESIFLCNRFQNIGTSVLRYHS